MTALSATPPVAVAQPAPLLHASAPKPGVVSAGLGSTRMLGAMPAAAASASENDTFRIERDVARFGGAAGGEGGGAVETRAGAGAGAGALLCAIAR